MIRLVVIRHGHTAWNAGEGEGQRFRGLVDLPLADEGIAQAQATAARLAGETVSAVYSSPLQRAVQTAEILGAPHGLSHTTGLQVLPGLNSMNYGHWAGQLHGEVAQRWPDLYRQWRHDPFSIQVPGGDHPAAVRDRAVAAVGDVLARHHNGETLILVTHQVITKTLAHALLRLPNAAYWRVRQDLCNLSIYDCEPGNGSVTAHCLNDTCHLGPALPRRRGTGLRLILVRHGQTAWNPGSGAERFRGRADLPLHASGLEQAAAVARRLAGEEVAAIYSSPLLRARQTAAPVAEAFNLPVVAHPGLLDIDYGLWQGLTPAEAAHAEPRLYELWRTKPGQVRFPEGENLASVQSRLSALLDQLAEAHPGQTVVLVGHQIVNKALACTLLGLDLDHLWCIGQQTAALNVFQRSPDGWDVLRLNDTCHLAADLSIDTSRP